MDHIDCMVAGGGVIGLAIARSLARVGREVVIVEAENIIGSHTSSRNSEVIHAGIYYATDSLKARFCVASINRLYAYCRERNIPHKQTGKLIVATHDEELPKLKSIYAQAIANGTPGMREIPAADAIALEPELNCVGALHSPMTGIVDSHALMLSLQGEAEDAGSMIAFCSRVSSVRAGNGKFFVQIEGDQPYAMSSDYFINAAGHGAWDIARSMTGLQKDHIPPHYLSKGSYYSLSGHTCPFETLVYPVPGDGSLGIHFTRDLAGQARFGPNVLWMEGEELDYSVPQDRGAEFTEAIRTYWPGLPDGALMPSYCGIRPKLVSSGVPAADFLIQSRDDHGVDGLVQLFGIESPGLTSCLVIGDYVAALVTQESR
ncbi:MAG: NAD(P)/FAD-dependent oxidoreductase [Hyphomicrobiales bacterium]|nr:NAD(P)/FAD-dependent oxidoreductase [Hyphomicrobiales bacterium]MCP5000514.1 NAD(P)/FAD-dependent oxidoreductase [Hyphomicrobiales bacterium]